MSRPPPTLPISARLYRHFAILTGGITLCLAMFAQGEGHEALAGAISKREHRNTELTVEAATVGKRRVAMHDLKFAPEGRAFLEFAPEPPADSAPQADGGTGPRSSSAYYRDWLTSEGKADAGNGPARATSDPRLAGLPDGQSRTQAARQRLKPRQPTPEELGRLLAASRGRAGSSAAQGILPD